jgi:hypothetical protein
VNELVFEIDAWGDPVGEGISGARYCTLGGVAKINGPNSQLGVANEYICGRLALVLGLPVPVGEVVRTPDGEIAYVALRPGRRASYLRL